MALAGGDPVQPCLVWVYPEPIINKLNSAPTLEMTRALRQLGWRVDLLMAGLPGPCEIQGVAVTGIPRPEIFFIKQLSFHLKVIRILLARWAAVQVVLFNPMSALWVLPLRLVRLVRGGTGPLLVMDTRTVPMEGKTATLKERLRAWFSVGMGWLANRYADGQTAITPGMAEALHIPEARLWGTWPSGVRLDEFLPAAAARRWPQAGDPIRLVYIGIFSVERDLTVLCKAVEKVNREGLSFELWLVGDGKERVKLQAAAAESGGRVRLVGRLPHAQIPGILAQAHLGLLPFPDELKFRISSFIKMFEYLGAGLPVLATRIAAHIEVLDGSPCAFWVKDATVEGLAAGLRRVWRDRDSLAERGEQAARLAEKHTWEASARQLSDALRQGLAERGKLRPAGPVEHPAG